MAFESLSKNRCQILWLLGTCLLIWLMIMLGGATRLTHSGLSIVEWKPVTGILPPLTEANWHQEFAKYQQFPEYKQINFGMSLEEFKFIFFMEYAHRLLGRLIGLVFFIPLAYFWVRGQLSPFIKKMSMAAIIVGGAQGVMGWYMVKSGLVKDPAVSHYRLAAHFLLAIVLYGMVFWTALTLLYPFARHGEKTFKGKKMVHVGALFLLLTMTYGAFVAGLKAGLIYNTYPLMGGQFLPSEWNFLTPVYLNFLENSAMVQWVHRTLAVITWAILCAAMIKMYSGARSQKLKRYAIGAMATVSLQVVLGILTLLYQVPVALGTLHQGMAVIVLTFVICVLFMLNRDDHFAEQERIT